ncbi:glycerophosphodiester phosphodiesterase [Mesorhizobium loti]|nr:glycerophosphodiester phosphodiesterase family protein [Mesorhizobium loti]PLP61235.1 glycerophosphodiester phosphodiesterase [Mesorhizobium loti]
MRKRTIALLGAFVAAGAIWALNSSLLAGASERRPMLIAHRGLGQTFSPVGIGNDTCTADRIHQPEHTHLENTIEGFQAAFASGADIVELDVHPTTDGDFAVFHDWTVDCRTDGKGVTREKSLKELKALDVGYGYTADGGKTFPFRGKGIGQMPSLGEVLTVFPTKRFLINIKSDDVAEGRLLARMIGALPPERQKLIMVYGGGKAIEAYKAALPEAVVLGTDRVVPCLMRYAALGWSGYVPEDCRKTLFMLPANYAPFAWGFPNRLSERLEANGSTLVILGDNDGSKHSTGVDDIVTFKKLPVRFDGAIWTNRVDRIGPAVAAPQ